MSSASFPAAQPTLPVRTVENVRRGTLVALLTIPVGIALWMVIWGFGRVAAIVGAVVAVLALRLYLWGAGRVSRVGAVVILAITVATLLLAFFGGIVLDAAQAIGDVTGLGAWGAFTHEEFWPTFWEIFPDAVPEYLPDFGLAFVFGAAGSFATLRGVFSATRAPAPAAAFAPPTQPPAAETQGTPGQF